MKIRYIFAGYAGVVNTLFIVGLIVAWWLDAGLVHGASSGTQEHTIERGRLIYEQGILPDGTSLQAMRFGSVLMEGARAACATCHRHSGMGSVEGSGDSAVLVPPLVGPLLFNAAHYNGSFLDRERYWIPNDAWARALTRSSYDARSFGRALRDGLDADGKPLQMPMPRYELDEQSVAALAAYLNQLARAEAPGVEPGILHLATAVTPDAPAGHPDAVLDVLRVWTSGVRDSQRKWRLHVWELSGSPDSWGEQLHARYRKQPVFAMLSGAGRAEWMPVHKFCEERRLPCILPSVELMPESPDGFYSLYYSPGVDLEARVLASHFNASQPVSGVVQVFSDMTGEYAAQALQRHLADNSQQVVKQFYLPGDPGDILKNTHRDGALVLWLRPEEIRQLVEELPQVPQVENIYLSALLAAPETIELPPEWKARVRWISLFDDLGVQAEIAKLRLQRWLQQNGLPDHGLRRVQADAYAACYLFTAALFEISKEEVRRKSVPLNRVHVLEALERLVNKYSDGTGWVNSESHIAYYGRMSLGPEQRMAVRGGTLLRYASPASRRLVTASERIVP